MADLKPIGYHLIIITFVFGFVALSTLMVRLWFRVRKGKFDGSDTFLIAAMICAILQSVIQLVLVLDFDYGTAKEDIPAHLRSSQWPGKLAYLNQILFKLTTPLSKLSLCWLYRAMCSTSNDPIIKVTRIAIWGTIVLIIGAYGSAFIISIFQCTPISKTWDKKADGTCIQLTDTAVFNLITSALVITLPIPTLLKLKTHRPEVKQLLGLILLGLVHTGLTIARFVIMFYPDPITPTEPQYAYIMTNCLAVVEMDIGIWVATLVVMRPAFKALYRILRPGHRADGSTTIYYSRSTSGRTGNAYHMKNFSTKSRKNEDEFGILETTDIHITSEGASAGRNTRSSNNSDTDRVSVERRRKSISFAPGT